MGGAQSQRVGSFDAASEGFASPPYKHPGHSLLPLAIPMGVLKSQIDGVPIYCREGSYLALDVSQQYIMILVCMRK